MVVASVRASMATWLASGSCSGKASTSSCSALRRTAGFAAAMALHDSHQDGLPRKDGLRCIQSLWDVLGEGGPRKVEHSLRLLVPPQK